MNNVNIEKDFVLSGTYDTYENNVTHHPQKVLEILITQAVFISAIFFGILNNGIGNKTVIDNIILLKLGVTLLGLVIVLNMIHLISKLDIVKIDFINRAFEKSSKSKFKMKNLGKKLNSRIIFSNISKYSLIFSLSFFLVGLILILVFLWINV